MKIEMFLVMTENGNLHIQIEYYLKHNNKFSNNKLFI